MILVFAVFRRIKVGFISYQKYMWYLYGGNRKVCQFDWMKAETFVNLIG